MFDPQGRPITDEFQVNEPASQAGQSMPCIAMDPTGRFVVAWTNWSDGCYTGKSHIFGRIFEPDGTPSGGDFVISDNTNADWADVGMDEGTPVVEDYQPRSTKFTGTIRKVIVDVKAIGAADTADVKKADVETKKKIEEAK